MPVLLERQGEARLAVRPDDHEMHEVDETRSPVVQHAGTSRHSRRPMIANDWWLAVAFVTVELEIRLVMGTVMIRKILVVHALSCRRA